MFGTSDSAKLAYLIKAYPDWTISIARGVWTATRRPTPTSLHFLYARDLDGLDLKLKIADSFQGT
jgi:hypothetical protein